MNSSVHRRLRNLLFLLGMVFIAAILTFAVLQSLGLLPAATIFQPAPSATGALPPALTQTSTFTPVPTHEPPASTGAATLPGPTPSPSPKYVWFSPGLPEPLVDSFKLSPDYQRTEKKAQAAVRVEIGREDLAGYWVYVLVSPFPSLSEGISREDLLSFWATGKASSGTMHPIHLEPDTRATLAAWLGQPASGVTKTLDGDALVDQLWPSEKSVAIIPFQNLEPKWKVLAVDGQHPLQTGFHPEGYALAVPISISGARELSAHLRALNKGISNFQPGQMTSVVMTGVTAMVRDTAALMEEKGIRYPARKIGPILRQADFTHISNEVPFAEDCPAPDPDQKDLYFCSSNRYLDLLEHIGTDIVELSGDHFGDWGAEAMHYTLSLYEDRGWHTYGGGKTLQAGLQPLQFEHNGNRLAFIGCNAKAGAKYATASDTEPGASRCNFPWMKNEIARLSDAGYLTIATMQHDEVYQFKPNYVQQRDFRALADAGAVIVSGSQAHQPQAVEFFQGSFIHYGLGNLFFDQYYLAQHVEKYRHADMAFIDRHVFYRGKHINTTLIPLQFVDNAQPRPMTEAEERQLLTDIFNASIW